MANETTSATSSGWNSLLSGIGATLGTVAASQANKLVEKAGGTSAPSAPSAPSSPSSPTMAGTSALPWYRQPVAMAIGIGVLVLTLVMLVTRRRSRRD